MSNHETDSVSREAVAFVLPLLQQWCRPGTTPIPLEGFRAAEYCQAVVGDYLVPVVQPNGFGRPLISVEVKGERAYTDNIWVELVSNIDAARGHTPSWMSRLRAELLAVAYLDVRAVAVLNFEKFQAWWKENELRWRAGVRIPGRSRTCEQKNLTVGVPVPFSAFGEAVGLAFYRPDETGRFVRVGAEDVGR